MRDKEGRAERGEPAVSGQLWTVAEPVVAGLACWTVQLFVYYALETQSGCLYTQSNLRVSSLSLAQTGKSVKCQSQDLKPTDCDILNVLR